MRFYFKDYDGNEVLTPSFTQYDSGQKIYVTDAVYDCNIYTAQPAFHFWNRNSKEVLSRSATLVEDTGERGSAEAVWTCVLPNSLLAEGLPFFAAFYLANEQVDTPACTVGLLRITMEQRPTPGFGMHDYSDETAISAQQVFNVIGATTLGDAAMTNDAIREATDGECSTYLEWLTKIANDTEQIREDTDDIKSDTQGIHDETEAIRQATNTLYQQTLAAKTATAQAAKDAITADVLNGYQIRVSTTAPTGAAADGQKIITFVVDA